MSSQYGEHQFILEFFGDQRGSFIDVGAYDGLTFSNTRPLMERGWRGICVEPNPLVFPMLMKNTEDFPEVELVNAAMGPRHGVVAFWVHQDCLSTSEARHRDLVMQHNPAIRFQQILAPMITWSDLGAHFADFVNIDVEGANAEVLECMTINAKLICVECEEREQSKISETLTSRGYLFQKMIGGNLLAWRGK